MAKMILEVINQRRSIQAQIIGIVFQETNGIGGAGERREIIIFKSIKVFFRDSQIFHGAADFYFFLAPGFL